jgi:hypothetical protein
MERGAVGEEDTDGAIGSGLDRVALVDELAGVDSSNNAAVAQDGDRTDRHLDLADGVGRRGQRPLSGAEQNAIIHTRRIAGATEHGDPPRLVTVSRPGWLMCFFCFTGLPELHLALLIVHKKR